MKKVGSEPPAEQNGQAKDEVVGDTYPVVEFQGRRLIRIDDVLTDPEAYLTFGPSYAVVRGEVVKSWNVVIGSASEIKDTGEVMTVVPSPEGAANAIAALFAFLDDAPVWTRAEWDAIYGPRN